MAGAAGEPAHFRWLGTYSFCWRGDTGVGTDPVASTSDLKSENENAPGYPGAFLFREATVQLDDVAALVDTVKNGVERVCVEGAILDREVRRSQQLADRVRGVVR